MTLTLITGAGCYGSFIPSFYPSCYRSSFCCFYTVQHSFFICITTDTTLERLITMTFGTEQGPPLQRRGTPRGESGMVRFIMIMNEHFILRFLMKCQSVCIDQGNSIFTSYLQSVTYVHVFTSPSHFHFQRISSKSSPQLIAIHVRTKALYRHVFKR